MSTENHRVLRELLGPMALGHLGAADATRARHHLAGCSSCQEELASLLPVVRQLQLLSDFPAESATRDPVDARWGPYAGVAEPPAGLADRIAGAVQAERFGDRRRRDTRTGVVATAAALAAAVVSALVVVALRPSGPTSEHVAVAVETSGVTADADLIAHTWGTEIKLNATGLVAGETYRVSVLTGDGAERPAGEFVGTGAQPLHCNLNSAVLRPDATGFVVLDDAGGEVLASTFT